MATVLSGWGGEGPWLIPNPILSGDVGNFVILTGLNTITNSLFQTGNHQISPSLSGTGTLGSPSGYWSGLYVNDLYVDTISTPGGGSFLPTGGGTMTGDIIFNDADLTNTSADQFVITNNADPSGIKLTAQGAELIVENRSPLSGGPFLQFLGSTAKIEVGNSGISDYAWIQGSTSTVRIDFDNTRAGWAHLQGAQGVEISAGSARIFISGSAFYTDSNFLPSSSSVTNIGSASHTFATGFFDMIRAAGIISPGSTIDPAENSIAFGFSNVASGLYSQAFGSSTKAIGAQSHAEGNSTTAWGLQSHTEGLGTIASGARSHAGGKSSETAGIATNSFVHGNQVHTDQEGSFFLGDNESVDSRNNIANSMRLRFAGGVALHSGTYLLAIESGTQNIGSESNPFATGFFDTLKGNLQLSTRLETSTYTIQYSDDVILLSGTGATTVLLPSSASDGDHYWIKNLGTTDARVSGVTPLTLIDEEVFQIVPSFSTLHTVYHTPKWYII